MNNLEDNAIFWVETDRIAPNPFQPRREFDQAKLEALADSIRQYGVLQPLVVTRREAAKEDGGLSVAYELIAGERRLRASKIAGVGQVPVVIRTTADSDREKLEIAIIENLQREDLNPIDKARAFQQLHKDFGFKHAEIARKMGKSREYVSNAIRLLSLPEDIQKALSTGEMSEGHTRPLLMLNDRAEEQNTLFREVLLKKLTVRETESIARRIAADKVRKKDRSFDPEILELERDLTESLGTRVQIEAKEVGGKIVIDYFDEGDLRHLLASLKDHTEGLTMQEDTNGGTASDPEMAISEELQPTELAKPMPHDVVTHTDHTPIAVPDGDIQSTNVPTSQEEAKKDSDDADLYSIKNFSV